MTERRLREEPKEFRENKERKEEIEALDERWFKKFKEAGGIEPFAYLDGDKEFRREQREKFLSGDVDNPDLDYPDLNLEELRKKEESLRDLKKKVLEEEENEIIRKTYRWRINEAIAQYCLLKAAAEEDMNRFRHYSSFIYGRPSEEIFAYTVNELNVLAERFSSSDDENIRTAANELMDVLPRNLPEVKPVQLPSEEDIEKARRPTMEEFGDLLEIVGGREEFKALEIKAIFEQALEELDIDNWEVVIDKSSRTGLAVSQEEEQVLVPEEKELLLEKMKGLLLHEIGTHVQRREKGQRSKLKLLGLGLDRSLKGEEGVAKIREQVLEEEVEKFAGLTGHLAIGLAKGVDGEPRDFRETFNIMKSYYYFNNLAIKGYEKEKAEEKANNSAWKRCVRVFRGTNCEAGTCFTKDIVYREGNIGVWQTVEDNPDEVRRFSLGKYDPGNDRHLWILSQLAITEEDLSRLDKGEGKEGK